MAGPLDAKVAVVTGGASGIGRATVVALAHAGAHVAVVDRVAADDVVAEVDGARGYIADVADASSLPGLVAQILADFGQIDILVNSAGITASPHSAIDFSDEACDLVLAVNLRAPAILIREVGRHMVERGQGGRIVSLSSSAAFRASSSPALYAASKAGVNGLTRAAAADLGRHAVTVNAVAPGLTKTPMTAGLGDDVAFDRAVQAGPLENLTGHASEPEDVAHAVVFLCLPASRQITGQVLHTSAGQVV